LLSIQLGFAIGQGLDLIHDDADDYVGLGHFNCCTPFIIRFNENGEILKTTLNGHLNFDANENCEVDSTDLPFQNNIVEVTNQTNQTTFYALADTLGNWTMDLDTGTYLVEPQIFSDYWTACEPEITVPLPNYNDTTEVEFSFIPEADCPLMFVDVSSPFYRRCFSNQIYVYYCNLGSATAENAQIEVILDDFMTFENASITPSLQMDSLLVFDLGDVPYGDCGNIQIQAFLDCDSTVLGQTHCVEAHIFPDTLCLENSYVGSHITITPDCQMDSVYFNIKNTGGDMDVPLPYIVIEDNIIAKSDTYQLLAGEIVTIAVEAQPEKTYHCQAQQPTAFPEILGNMDATATIEGCISPINLGVFAQFPDDDGEPYLSIDCQQNIGSFDPNDKRGLPTGLGDDHLIEVNESIDYHIRFQNTGTDTAFTVIIRDTLSQFLDVGSLRAGVSSHSYQLEISGQGNLAFIFEDILLPDSTTNEAASHGFVKFKIDQKLDLPIGTIIENTAAIYFDFNEAVITNTTFHEIAEDFIDVLPNSVFNAERKEILTIISAPNPFQEFTVFDLSEFEKEEIQFELFTLSGQKIREEIFQNNQYYFERKNLQSGIYFYRFLTKEGLIGSGKFFVR